MPFLPGVGTASYNGFDMTSRYLRSKVKAQPIYDDANRARKYVEYTIDCTFYLSNNGPNGCDLDMEDIRRRLTKPGGPLVFINRGFGTNLSVNTGAGPMDSCWGPHPQILSWTNLGSNVGARIEWTCVTRIPECDGATTWQFGIASLVYEWATAIDADGYTTLDITGKLEIPMTRKSVDDRSVPDSADRYRSKIRPDVPLGFQRIDQSFKLSMDKRTLSFAFKDKELPAPLPPLATKCEVHEKVSSQLEGAGFRRWTLAFAGTIVLSAGVPKARAWIILKQIVESRLRGVLNAGDFPLPHSLDVDDNIFGRETSFDATFWLMNKDKNGITISAALSESGLWQPVAGTDFQTWKTSLANLAFHERGSAKLAHNPSDDAIIDLCQTTPPKLPSSLRSPGTPVPPRIGGFGSNQVDPAASWLWYKVFISYRERSSVSVHRLMIRPAPSNNPEVSAYGVSDPGQTGGVVGKRIAPIDNIIQQGGNAGYEITLYVSAARIGFEISMPTLQQLGGRPATEVDRIVNAWTEGQVNGLPLYRLEGWIFYVVPNMPVGVIGPPSNPFLRTATPPTGGTSTLVAGGGGTSSLSTGSGQVVPISGAGIPSYGGGG